MRSAVLLAMVKRKATGVIQNETAPRKMSESIRAQVLIPTDIQRRYRVGTCLGRGPARSSLGEAATDSELCQ